MTAKKVVEVNVSGTATSLTHRTPMVPVRIACWTDDGTLERVTVHGEPTVSEHLVITPTVSRDGELDGTFRLTHAPTGLAITSDTPESLQGLARRLAHLNWGDVTRENFPGSDMADEAAEVIRGWRLTSPLSIELPAHDAWGPEGKGHGLKRAAVPMAADMLVDARLAVEKIHGEKAVPMDVPDPERPGDVRANPEWMYWVTRRAQDCGLAYLLLALHQVDSRVADSAAAFLADSWELGDGIEEWVHEWHQSILKGEQPHVPGVPQFGEMFTS